MARVPDLTLDAGLPANIDAERTILGAVLLDNSACDEAFMSLEADDLSLDSHRRICLAMRVLRRNGQPIDIVTLAHHLASRKDIENVGGVAYLASLTEGLPLRPVIEEYVKIVKDKSLLRRLMALASATIARAADQSETALEIASFLSSSLEQITEKRADLNKAPIQSFIVDELAEINSEYRDRTTPCIPSGNIWLDTKTGGGYRQGKITLVCARPNVGKTPWLVASAAHNCKQGRKTVLFSLEMEKGELLRSLIPWVTDLPNVVCARPSIQTPEQNAIVNQAMNTLVEWPLEIYDGEMDIDHICWVIDRATRNGEEVLFGLDHFGLIAGGDRKDTRSRYNENSARLRKKLKHKSAALVALCQLRKVNREFADKPPVPDDIKESGNMYEDAYACLIIHRAFEEESLKMSRKAHLNLCKLRSGGSTGSTTADFDVRRLAFEAEAEMDYFE